jgi:methanogenic corrinoid protein MtbC1
MSDAYNTPIYNLKAVVQKTGLKPDTLRAWERRYDLPQPDRTEGGHRLYSQRDVDIIKWLIARRREGLNIKRAVALWRKLEEEGRAPLRTAPIAPSPPATVIQGSTIADLREAWIAACLDFDEQTAEGLLTQAFALYPPETVGLDLLLRGLAQIGQAWYEGHVTVQQEHFASELAVRRLEALLMAAPPPSRPGQLLVACPPGELHTLGPLVLTLMLRRQGWNVTYLGANVPIERMEATVSSLRPRMVILSAQQLHTAATLLDMARFLQQQEEEPAVVFGGGIFNRLPTLRTRIPGHFLGESLKTVGQVVEHLMTAPRSAPEVEPGCPACEKALSHYRQQRPLIEATVWEQLADSEVPADRIGEANRRFARNVEAALSLGDIDFMDVHIGWVEGLQREDGITGRTLPPYLRVYRDAIETHLDERGQPILDWLTRRIEG